VYFDGTNVYGYIDGVVYSGGSYSPSIAQGFGFQAEGGVIVADALTYWAGWRLAETANLTTAQRASLRSWAQKTYGTP
jgi:hypothetical protein